MLLQIITSILITILLGFGVRPLLHFSTRLPPPPEPITAKIWEEIFSRGKGAGVSVLGGLERLLYLGAFWMKAPVIIVGWLAFKVASGWHNWSMIIKLPEDLEDCGVGKIEYLRARSQLGSWVFQRFLIGTLANILISLIAVMLSKILIH